MIRESPKYIDLNYFQNPMGCLTFVESGKDTSFPFQRIYYLYDTPLNSVRGNHAHKKLKQVIVCLYGSVEISLDNGEIVEDFILDDPKKGLIVPPGYWRDLSKWGEGTVVAVMASEHYDESDYIRRYEDFIGWKQQENKRAQTTVPYIPLDRQHSDLAGKLNVAFNDVLSSGSYIGGEKVSRFEANFAKHCGQKYAVGCGNGLDALTLILKALDIGFGDEVIVPANSFYASALAVTRLGATPVFSDVDLDSGLITAKNITPLITPRTKAIMPVHLYGLMVDCAKIKEVIGDRNIYIVEDAAQAFGATINGYGPGTYGAAAAFSFYPTKVLGALGDGGAVVTNDERLAKKIRQLGSYGKNDSNAFESLGANSRLDSLQAAILDVKLEYFENWINRRRILAEIYYQELGNIKNITLPKVDSETLPSWHVYAILVHENLRDDLNSYLNEHGIATSLHYKVPLVDEPAMQFVMTKKIINSMKISRYRSENMISLPLDPYHTDEEIYLVCKVIKNYCTQKQVKLQRLISAKEKAMV